MARKLIVELIADPRGYTAGLQTAAKETKVFGAEMDKATRGILSGTGAIHGLGRSLAFASGGFLAFAGVSKFLEDSVSAARDAGVAQRSLAAQMKASGDSFAANQAAIQKASLSLEKFGFTSEDSEKALTVLERGTGSITKAISLQGVAANLARAKNIDLASAANVLAKVFGGQETALRRAVPGLDKHAHGLQLIAEAQQRLAGQAKAGTTEVEKFHAILHNTEVIIGTALLPTLNKFLESLGKWLQKMNESGRLQKDVNEVVKDATGIFQDVLAVVRPLVTAFQDLGKVLGGTKTEVQDFALAFAAFKISKLISGMGLLSTSVKGVGTQAEAATAATSRLSGALGALGAIGVITVTIQEEIVRKQARQSLADQGGSPVLALDPGAAVGKHQTRNGVPGTFKMINGQLWWMPDKAASSAAQLGPKLGPPVPDRLGVSDLKIPGGAYGNTAASLSAAQQRAIGLAADPQNLRLLRQQAVHDRVALDFAKKLRSSGRISNAKYVSEVTAYASDLQQTNSTISGILQAARQKVADAAKVAADKTAAAAAKQNQAAQDAAQKAQQAQQNMLDALQFNVDKSALTKTLQDDLENANTLVRVLKELIRTRGSTLDLQKQLLAAELQSSGIQQQITDNRKAAVQAAKDAAAAHAQAVKQATADAAQRRKDRAAAAATARDALQFRLLGLGPTGGAIVPGMANLRTRLTGIRGAVKGTFLDTSKTGSELDHIARILAGKFGSVSESVRSAIDQMYKDIRDKLKSHQGDQTKFRHMSSTAFVDSLGLNLTGAQRRAIESRFATVGAHGTVPGGRSGQFTGGVTITGDVHVNGVQDIGAFENQITKRAKARAHTRRGT